MATKTFKILLEIKTTGYTSFIDDIMSIPGSCYGELTEEEKLIYNKAIVDAYIKSHIKCTISEQ